MTEQFNILVYNIFSPVPEFIRMYGQKERAMRVKDVVRDLDQKFDLDVIIMNEVIHLNTQKIVFRDMPDIGFKYKTRKISEGLKVHGGIIVFSKHPITQECFTIFGDECVGTDCLADKGCVYARVKKNGMYFNVFGTHLQAWPSIKAYSTRAQQIDKVKTFMDTFNIPKEEPVLFAGDLNTDLYVDSDHVRHMHFVLGTDMPDVHPDSHPFTVDPKENKLVGNDDPNEYVSDSWPNGCVDEYYKTLECPCCPSQWIDYTLYSKRHLLPIESDTRVIKAKVSPFKIKVNMTQEAEVQDVSDHFPVLGHFVFPHSPSTDMDRVADTPLKLTYGTNSSVIVIAIVISVVGFLFVVLGFYALRSYVKSTKNNNEKSETPNLMY